ncbi:MAG: rod-binding protein [Armatimonadota bacterium]|jgi:flagellar protein FlgJ
MQISNIRPSAGASGQMTREQEELRKACQDMEATFLRYLLQKMRESIPDDGLVERSSARKTYEEMLDGALAESISRQGSFGLAEMLYRQLEPSIRKESASPTPAVSSGGEGESEK